MARIAVQVPAGLGFYLHAFSECHAAGSGRVRAAATDPVRQLAEVARFAGEQGPVPIVVEQMYTPHQTPWTIEGTFEYLREVPAAAGTRRYVAMDTGHQTGQHRFLRPSREAVERALAARGRGPRSPTWDPTRPTPCSRRPGRLAGRPRGSRCARSRRRWTGTRTCSPGQRTATCTAGWRSWAATPRSFTCSRPTGSPPPTCPSPAANNETGHRASRQSAPEAIARSYGSAEPPGHAAALLPLYLTFEIFPHTTDRPRDILPRLAESVRLLEAVDPRGRAAAVRSRD